MATEKHSQAKSAGPVQARLFAEPQPWEQDDASSVWAASVVLAEPPFGPFDYSVPETLRDGVEPGRRLRVPLGRGNRKVVGYCIRIGPTTVAAGKLKPVQSVVDDVALLSPSMLRLTEWMSDYYLCPWGQVLDAVVPAGVRARAGTRQVLFLSVPSRVAARLTQLKLPPKQAEVLQTLSASPQPLTPVQLAELAQCTQGPISALRRKQLIVAESHRVSTTEVEERDVERQPQWQMNPDQQRALDMIQNALERQQHETVLIQGVTGSGKTEIYIRAIEQVIAFGRQAIVLVPEISLTPQTRQRFRSRFDRVAVLHSHLTPSERHWHWQRIAAGEIQVVVGARSAVFAPTPHLGLIVLDEEHDASFKQDLAPRYHARDVAMQRARMEHVPLVLGSATPSLESWHAARQGQYQFVELPDRVLARPLPHVASIDLRNEFADRQSRGAVSRPLHQAIAAALKDNGQVILLLNRRGFSTNIQCPACGFVVKCPHCDISLTHHRESEKVVCHYCDYAILAPTRCPECKFEGIRYSGLGVQRLEAEIRSRFRDVRCLRMDSDTMKKPGSHEAALDRFRSGEIQILLGTQMIAKGLDFPNVTLVGVINADTALHFPDFRAAERTFQLVTQVAGRTGRGDKGGRVLVQTFSPEHPAIQAALGHNFTRFALEELPLRAAFGYPPVAALIRLVVRGPAETVVEQFAESIADRLRAAVKEGPCEARILGPAPAPIAKLRGRFRFHILASSADAAALRSAVRAATSDLDAPADVQWIVDVDPQDLL